MSHKNGPGRLSGVLVVDKPEGVTSHDVVARARKALGLKKIGHAGTLDPFATGLLILLVGEGTKLSNYLMEGRKTYRACIKLGERRDTADLTGQVVESAPFDHISPEDVKEALASFEGETRQLPPMYSALKKDGVPLYKYARKGVEVERKERTVHIDAIDLVSFDPPCIDIEVTCSKGTYIRTLAEDISARLGSCGHLVKLRRIRSGALSLERAISFDGLAGKEDVVAAMIPLADAISQMPALVVSDEGALKIRSGMRLKAGWIESRDIEEGHEGDLYRVLTRGKDLVSIAVIERDMPGRASLPGDFELGKSVRVFNDC